MRFKLLIEVCWPMLFVLLLHSESVLVFYLFVMVDGH